LTSSGFGQLQKLDFALNLSIFSSKELVKEANLNQQVFSKPKIILMDEATSALDNRTQASLLNVY
jgi:energy-coupling factor transporter ATP-binding protein EcfA2